MKINLRTDKTEYLSDDEVYQFFVPSEDMNNISKIKNSYIIGHKGSGKSFILKYLSVPIQLIRFAENTTIEFDERAIGILIQCNVGKFGGLREFPNVETLDKDWIKVFTHIFNLCVVEIFLDAIKQIYENKKDIDIKEIEGFIEKISRMFRLEIGTESYEKVLEMIDDEISLIQEEFQQDKLRNENRFYTDHKLLYELRKVFQKCFKNYKNIEPIFLLDEYNELSTGQQKIINEMIRIRQPVFKMCTIPHGYIKDRVYEGQTDIDHDFDIIYLANKLLTPKSGDLPELQKFMKEVWKKRIKSQPIKKTIDKLLQTPKKFSSPRKKRTRVEVRKENESKYCGFSNYVTLSEGNPKTFLDLVQTTIDRTLESGVDIIKKPIPVTTQLNAIFEYSIQRRKEVVQSDPKYGRKLQRLIEYFGKYLRSKTINTNDQYRSLAIRDAESLSEMAYNTIELGLRTSWLIQEDVGRVSKNEKIRLQTFTLKNILIPSFELPLTEHQIWELNSEEINNLLEYGEKIKEKIEGKTKKEKKIADEKPAPLELTLDSHTMLSEIIELITKNELILFVGSGLSSYAGMISAPKLTEKIGKKIDLPSDTPLEKAAEFYASKNDDYELTNLLKNELKEPSKLKLDLHKNLEKLKIKIIVTTNWDNLIEKVIKENNSNSQVIVNQEQLMNYNEENPAIFKIHGDLDNSDLIVVTEGQYDNYSNTHDFMLTRLKSILQHKSVLFIGYSLSDRNFTHIRNMVGNELGKIRKSYAILPKIGEPDKSILEKKKIFVIPYDFRYIINALVQQYEKQN